MIKLLQDTKMSIAGIDFTVPEGFSICIDKFPNKKYNTLRLAKEGGNCCMEICSVKSEQTFNVRNNFISNIEKRKSYTINGKIEERIENYMYSIRAEYESINHKYFEMHLGQRKGYDKRIEILIITDKNQDDMTGFLKSDDIKKFIESFKFAQI